MSDKLRPSQFADQKGIIAEGFVPNLGILSEGAVVPVDGSAGYEEGCLFFKRSGVAGGNLYKNEGTKTSSLFKPFADQTNQVTNPVAGIAAGYKLARGQLSTVSAVDTVVTGLATVVSVVAVLESDPTDTCDVATAQVGDQAGTPAAGSIFIKTWKVTTGGAAGNPTLIAATAFSKKVNWIAIGT